MKKSEQECMSLKFKLVATMYQTKIKHDLLRMIKCKLFDPEY